MESDPNVLLALAAAVIDKTAPTQQTGPPVHPFTSGDDANPHSLPVLVGPATAAIEPTVPNSTNDDDTNICTATVLDSIAGVCISSSSRQVVAVALEMDVTSHIAVLTIADDLNTVADLVPYLNGLWRLMRVLSNQCAKQDKHGQLSAAVKYMEPWRTEFVRRVYRFGGMKIILCIEIHWSALARFLPWFERKQSTLVGDPLFKEQFTGAIYSIEATRKLLSGLGPGGDLTDTNWTTLISRMDWIVANVESLLETTLLETWAHELQRVFHPTPYYPHFRTENHAQPSLGCCVPFARF